MQELTHFDNYVLPSIDLLDQHDMDDRPATDLEELRKIQATLIATLAQFEISVEAGDITKGPAITRYEVYPANGVRMSKIVRLEHDIARAIRAARINILAPIPGKNTVGIEIVNTRRVKITLRELMESEDFMQSKAKIPLALGKDIYGKTIVGDLAAMPHCLIAGTTGSGKSVCINSIITSMLYKFTPEEIRFIMIDPKVVEMQVYNTLPHLVIPVVTDSKKALLALRWVIDEMKKRYKIFAKTNVRNITSFNARQMPHIAIIVDNLADLKQTAPTDFENAIARITEMGRAVGVHMIIATNTPRISAVTNISKSNIPTRIAFQCTARSESHEILGVVGAEKLSGAGDMLVLFPGSTEPIHAQCVFTTDLEIHRIVDFVSKQRAPIFESPISDNLQSSSTPLNDVTEEDEELVQKCVEIMRQEKKASHSLFQRRLRLGYTRAAHLVNILEQRGYIALGEGAKPREILRDLDTFVYTPPQSPPIESPPIILPNFVVCFCEHCGQKIEFDTNELGDRKSVVVPCPTCGVETNLRGRLKSA